MKTKFGEANTMFLCLHRIGNVEDCRCDLIVLFKVWNFIVQKRASVQYACRDWNALIEVA